MSFRNGNTCIIALQVKVNFTLEQAIKAHMGSTLSVTLALDEVHGKCRAPPILHPGKLMILTV
jgi:hypothetical protein